MLEGIVSVPSWRVVRAVLFASATAACSAAGTPEHGVLQLPLTSAAQGTTYELVDAVIQISGPSPLTLTSSGSTDATLSAVLSAGDYTAELEDGWRLMQQRPEGAEEVQATLTSDNPREFTIAGGATTSVTFSFQTDGGPVGSGEGNLDLGIQVEKLAAQQMVFTEFMKNPAVLSDAEGEWLELVNSGTETFSLEGCLVRRDTTQFTINGALVVQPGHAVTLANSEAPGFVPDYVYSSVSLPNTAAFLLELECNAAVVDSVWIDPVALPNAAGASLSLDPAHTTAFDNDGVDSWCNGTSDYNQGDLGTPGLPNPNCG